MSEAAVAEAETQAEEVEPTQAPEQSEGTEPASDVQTDTPDYVQKAIADALAAKEEELRQKVEQEKREAAKASARKAKVEAAKRRFPEAARAARAEMSNWAFRTADGQEVRLSEEQQQAVIKHFEKYNLDALNAASDIVAGDLGDLAEARLPADQLDKFSAEYGDKPFTEWLDGLIEYAALSSKAIKSLSLEAALAASPKLKAEHSAALAKAFEDGRKKGRSDPPAEPEKDERAARPAYSNTLELDRAFNQGLISAQEWRRQRDTLRQRS